MEKPSDSMENVEDKNEVYLRFNDRRGEWRDRTFSRFKSEAYYGHCLEVGVRIYIRTYVLYRARLCRVLCRDVCPSLGISVGNEHRCDFVVFISVYRAR